MIGAWIVGFALYQWLYPTGPGWWIDAVDGIAAPDWGTGATVPSFLVSFGLALAASAVERRPSLTPRATDS